MLHALYALALLAAASPPPQGGPPTQGAGAGSWWAFGVAAAAFVVSAVVLVAKVLPWPRRKLPESCGSDAGCPARDPQECGGIHQQVATLGDCVRKLTESDDKQWAAIGETQTAIARLEATQQATLGVVERIETKMDRRR